MAQPGFETDELGALVFDIGQNSLRIGYAQEDSPHFEISTDIGFRKNKGENDTYYMDSVSLNKAKANVEIFNCMENGMIENWDVFEKMLDYSYSKCFQYDSANHPVLMTEPIWNLKSKRERLTELMFEKYSVPAYYLVKNAVAAAFAHGRYTGLIIDSGASHTSVIPILNGFVLYRCYMKSCVGGNFLREECKKLLEKNNIDIIPTYMIADKQCVNEKESPKWTRKTKLPIVTESWHKYMVKQVIDDFKHSVLQVSPRPVCDMKNTIAHLGHYEFPNGYHQDFGNDCIRIPEIIFNPGPEMEHGNMKIVGLKDLVKTCIAKCDLDIQPALYGSCILTGGNTSLKGFGDRLTYDVIKHIPSMMRFKLISSNSMPERRFSAWIGGSILASLRSFQQMWISREEYFESGKQQVHLKCP